MSQSEEFLRNADTIGGEQAKQPFRKFEILAKDFTSTEQGNPVPVIYGTAKIAGTSITPVWNFQAFEVVSRAGK